MIVAGSNTDIRGILKLLAHIHARHNCCYSASKWLIFAKSNFIFQYCSNRSGNCGDSEAIALLFFRIEIQETDCHDSHNQKWCDGIKSFNNPWRKLYKL